MSIIGRAIADWATTRILLHTWNPNHRTTMYKEIFSSSYPQDLEPIVKLLGSYGIDGRVETSGSEFSASMAFNRPPDAVKLMVPADEYDRARVLLIAKGILADADEDEGLREMLGDLDNDELMEMLADAKRQPADQVAFARKLLQERGQSTEPQTVRKKLDEITSAERMPTTLSFTRRLLLVFFSTLFPIFGLGAAVVIGLFKGRDARGDSYWMYSNTDRLLFLVVGIVCGSMWLAFYFLIYL